MVDPDHRRFLNPEAARWRRGRLTKPDYFTTSMTASTSVSASIALIGGEASSGRVVRRRWLCARAGSARHQVFAGMQKGTQHVRHRRSASDRCGWNRAQVAGHPLWVGVSADLSEIYKSSRSNLAMNTGSGCCSPSLRSPRWSAFSRRGGRKAQGRPVAGYAREHEPGHHAGHQGPADSIINRRSASCSVSPRSSSRIRLGSTSSSNIKRETEGRRRCGAVRWSGCPGSKKNAVVRTLDANGTVIRGAQRHLPDGSLSKPFTDITKRVEAESSARLASEDPLPGLPNRRVFRAALDQISHRRRKSRDEAEFRGDVPRSDDRFKVVKDTLGHRVATCCSRRRCAPEACCGRTSAVGLGGDEFSIVVRDFESRIDLEALANRLVEAVVHPYDISGYHIARVWSSMASRSAVGNRRDATDLPGWAADLCHSMRSRAQPRQFQFVLTRDE